MSDETNHHAVLVHLDYIKGGIDAINRRLDIQNGRIAKSEMASASLDKSIALLEDRSTEARQAARYTGAKWGASVGAGAAAAMAALWNHFWGN
jgi:hypothetical protein